MRRLTAALAAIIALGACQSESDPPGYTCDASATAALTCTHWPVDTSGGYSEWYCGQQGGTWGADLPCPTENLVASCAHEGSTQYWYVGTSDLAGIESQCTMYGGVWTTYP